MLSIKGSLPNTKHHRDSSNPPNPELFPTDPRAFHVDNQTSREMSDDIESNIYCLKTEEHPFNIEQTSEAPTAAVNVNAELPIRKKRTRRCRSDPEPEYSEQVRENHKRKMQKSDRSPHACDRCKVNITLRHLSSHLPYSSSP